jgi:hypothetical protein
MNEGQINLRQVLAQAFVGVMARPGQEVHIACDDERDVLRFAELIKEATEHIKIELRSTERGPNPEVPAASVIEREKLVVPTAHDQVLHPKSLIVPREFGR